MLHKSPECILKPEVAYEHLRYLKESRRFHRHRIACHERKCPRQRKNETKILAIMAENDYTPNAFARGLGLNTMKTIGLLCADSSDQFFSRAVYYLERALRSNHYDAILSCTGADYDTRTEYLKRLLAKKVDAVILVGSSFIEAVPERNRYIIDAAEEVPVIIFKRLSESAERILLRSATIRKSSSRPRPSAWSTAEGTFYSFTVRIPTAAGAS